MVGRVKSSVYLSDQVSSSVFGGHVIIISSSANQMDKSRRPKGRGSLNRSPNERRAIGEPGGSPNAPESSDEGRNGGRVGEGDESSPMMVVGAVIGHAHKNHQKQKRLLALVCASCWFLFLLLLFSLFFWIDSSPAPCACCCLCLTSPEPPPQTLPQPPPLSPPPPPPFASFVGPRFRHYY